MLAVGIQEWEFRLIRFLELAVGIFCARKAHDHGQQRVDRGYPLPV